MKIKNLSRAISAFWSVLNGADQPKQVVVKNQVSVLSRESYNVLERKMKPPLLDNQSQPLYAGYVLGIQHVLKAIRDDHTQNG